MIVLLTTRGRLLRVIVCQLCGSVVLAAASAQHARYHAARPDLG